MGSHSVCQGGLAGQQPLNEGGDGIAWDPGGEHQKRDLRVRLSAVSKSVERLLVILA